jgi:hypothetical protein
MLRAARTVSWRHYFIYFQRTICVAQEGFNQPCDISHTEGCTDLKKEMDRSGSNRMRWMDEGWEMDGMTF